MISHAGYLASPARECREREPCGGESKRGSKREGRASRPTRGEPEDRDGGEGGCRQREPEEPRRPLHRENVAGIRGRVVDRDGPARHDGPVSEAGARTAITDYLTAPAAGASRSAGAVEAHGWRASIVAGKSFTAVPASVRFVKERGTADRQLCAVAFDDEDGRGWFYLVVAERDGAGRWVAREVGGGRGPEPPRADAWLNFCGCWGQGRMYGGGRVQAPAEVGRVVLTVAGGTQLCDDADAGVVLFLADHGSEPVRVDIFDPAGQLLATHVP